MSIGQIIILSIIGLAGGGIIAAGVFALITTTGVMTRFSEKTHTAKYVRQYENAVAFGAITKVTSVDARTTAVPASIAASVSVGE